MSRYSGNCNKETDENCNGPEVILYIIGGTAHLAVALAAARRGALPAIRSLQGCVLAECDAESFWALSRRPSSGFCPWQGSKPLSLLSSNFLTAGGSAEQREAALRSCLSEGAHRNASAFASYK